MDLLVWPSVVVVIAISAFLIFRTPISQLISRTQKLGRDGAQFGGPANAEEQQKQVEAGTSEPSVQADLPPDAPPPPPDAGYADIELSIQRMVSSANASEEVKRNWLIRGLAIARVERTHEIVFRLIFGSQIELLLAANTGVPVALENARTLYDNAVVNFPAMHAGFDFENWLAWPINMGLLRRSAGEHANSRFEITPRGRHGNRQARRWSVKAE